MVLHDFLPPSSLLLSPSSFSVAREPRRRETSDNINAFIHGCN